MSSKYDFVIIGGGAAGFAAAIKAEELKAKTLMVNTGLPLGGTCVNVGCVPSKRLLWAGKILHLAKNHGIKGIGLEVKFFDFAEVIREEMELVEKLQQEKYKKVLSNLGWVKFVEGRAVFRSPQEIEVNGEVVQAEKFLIATGSTTTIPPIKGIKDVGFITHIEALQLRKQPRELVVIGAGPLGLEFSQMFSRFGTKVTVLELLPSIFSPGEASLVQQLQEILEKEGITIKTKARVIQAVRDGEKKVLKYLLDGKEYHVSGDEILLAPGKTPNTAQIGLEKIGIELDRRKAVRVNEFLQTSQKHIYAAGDVTNLPMRLETTAGREGTIAAENALTGTKKSIDYSTVPYTIFTDPNLAAVGLTEEEGLREFKACACRTVRFTDIPMAIIRSRTEGTIKMLIHPETSQILGVHILAPDAGELIAQAMLIIKNKLTIHEVIESLPVFPTLSEAIKLCALSFIKDISNLSCCI